MKNLITLFSTACLCGLFLMSLTNKNIPSDDWEVPSKYEKLKNPYAGVGDDDQIGRSQYSVHCKSCHGSKGKGDGSKSKELNTPVPDITTDAFKAQSDGAIYYKTYIGREDMPSFIKKISDEEDQWLLVNYLRTL